MGHILSSERLFPEPEKVDSILNMESPSNTSEVYSFFWVLEFTTVNLFEISQVLLNH